MAGGLDRMHDIGGVVGTAMSAAFLPAVGLADLLVLRGVQAAFARACRGDRIVGERVGALLAGRGLPARALRPPFGLASRPCCTRSSESEVDQATPAAKALMSRARSSGASSGAR